MNVKILNRDVNQESVATLPPHLSSPNASVLDTQPLGIFPLPASYLILPKTAADSSAARAALLNGDAGIDWPAEWQFYALALQSRIDEAFAALGDLDFTSHYNRFVLKSDPIYRCSDLNFENDIAQMPENKLFE